MLVEVKRIAKSAPFFVTFFELKKSKSLYLSTFFPQKSSKKLGAGFCNLRSTFEKSTISASLQLPHGARLSMPYS